MSSPHTVRKLAIRTPGIDLKFQKAKTYSVSTFAPSFSLFAFLPFEPQIPESLAEINADYLVSGTRW